MVSVSSCLTSIELDNLYLPSATYQSHVVNLSKRLDLCKRSLQKLASSRFAGSLSLAATSSEYQGSHSLASLL